MGRIEINQSAWPVVEVNWPSSVEDEEIHAHFDEVAVIVERGEPFVVLVDLNPLERQTQAQRKLVSDRMRALSEEARDVILAVAHVADNWLARAVLSTVFFVSPAPFPEKVFRDRVAARAWVESRLTTTNPNLTAPQYPAHVQCGESDHG